MSFEFFKELHDQKEDQKFILENLFEIEGIYSNDQQQLQENIKQFLNWARTIVSRPVVNQNQIERDPTVSAGEAPDVNVKDEKDAYAKLSKTIAGLVYFMNNKVQDDNRNMISAEVHGKKEMDDYVKKFGVQKALDVAKKVMQDLKTKDREYIKQTLDKIQQFYKLTPIR